MHQIHFVRTDSDQKEPAVEVTAQYLYYMIILPSNRQCYHCESKE